MKALKNFSCNGVKKKKGDSISSEEMNKMGDLGKKLQFDDFISNGEAQKPEPKKEDPKPGKKKVSKKA